MASRIMMQRGLAGLLLLTLIALTTACGGADARKERYLAKGQELMAAGNYEKARLEFRNAILQGIIGVVFNEAMQRIVRAFERRAAELYGPGPI